MNREELQNNLIREFKALNSDCPVDQAVEIMSRVDDYIAHTPSGVNFRPEVDREPADAFEAAVNEINNTPDAFIRFRINDGLTYGFTKYTFKQLGLALTFGYTVAPEKKYVLPIPMKADDKADEYQLAYCAGDLWFVSSMKRDLTEQVDSLYKVTKAQIDAAPDWVKALAPVEVTDDNTNS
ncbi:hypothetical protein [Lacticaseibacillus saniviri]